MTAVGLTVAVPSARADQAVMDLLFKTDHMATVATPMTVVYDFASTGEALKARRNAIRSSWMSPAYVPTVRGTCA